jgi:hypothetical protein
MAEFIARKRALALAAGAAANFLFPALARAAEADVTADNLVFVVGATTYRIPRLELKGATLSAAELAELFNGDEKAIDARLARLSAKSLAMPSLSVETRGGETVERATYRDLTAQGVVAGRIANARTSGAEQTVERPGVVQRFSWGATAFEGVDLRQLAHVRLATRGDPAEALKPVVDEERVDSLTLEDESRKITVKSAGLAVTGVKARPLSAPVARLLEKPDADKLAGDAALLGVVVDALGSFEIGAIEAKGLAINGKGEPADKPFSVTMGRLAASKIADAVIGDLAIEDFSLFSSDGGKLTLERFGLRDARLASLVEGSYPRLGHMEFKGLAADLPDVRTEQGARMKFSLAGAEADFSDFREIAPTKIAARMDRLAIDLAARGEAPSTAQFLALGYRSLDLSAALAAEWNEKTQEAIFAPLRFEGKDMGAASLNVTLGNVSGAVFSSMAFVSKAAALASSVKSVELSLEGGGLVDRILALEAKERKTPVEKARADYAKAAFDLVARICGGGEKAKRVADAVSAYILKPKRLHLRLASEEGVNALDALARKPGDILESLKVEATAER